MLTRRVQCAELEAQVAALRAENQELREQVTGLSEQLRIGGRQFGDLSDRFVALVTEVCRLREDSRRRLLAWRSARLRTGRRGWS